MSFLFSWRVGLGANFFIFGFPTVLFRFVEDSISSGCSLSVFYFFALFLDFWQVMEVVMEIEVEVVYMLLLQLVLVLSLLLFWLLFLLLLLLLFLLLLDQLFCWSSFSPFWSPGSTLLPVCLGGPQITGQDWWSGRWFFPGYYCWCCCCGGCLTYVGRFLINNIVVCRTCGVASWPPWTPPSAGPYKSVNQGL